MIEFLPLRDALKGLGPAEDDYVKRACLQNSLDALGRLLSLPLVSPTLPLLVVVTKMDCATAPLISTTEIRERVSVIVKENERGSDDTSVSRRWAVCGTSAKDGVGFDGLSNWIARVSLEQKAK